MLRKKLLVVVIIGLFYYSCENTITDSPDILDCNNVLNGSASLDDCGLCTGGTTIFEFNYLMDCEGECGGFAVKDCAGICNGTLVEDCAGVCNGSAFLDECDVCGGDNSICTDCVGIINGSAFTDNCDDCVGGTTGFEACPLDCAGIDGGASLINPCGDCVIEGNATDILCIQGCDGNWSNNGSELLNNDCGVCGADNSTSIVINEINYSSSNSHDTEDWVELHNPTDEDITIGTWKLKDEDNDHVFTIPENTILSAGDFIVLCKDIDAFEKLFPEVNNFIGDLGFRFSSTDDMIRLFDSNEIRIDSVAYNYFLWPITEGTGATLELKCPHLNNLEPENWLSSTAEYGTPGKENSVYTKNE